jgi:hypothetical protein
MDKLEKETERRIARLYQKLLDTKRGVIWSVSLVRAGCRRERILQQQQPEKSKEKEKSCRQKYKVCLCAE